MISVILCETDERGQNWKEQWGMETQTSNSSTLVAQS